MSRLADRLAQTGRAAEALRLLNSVGNLVDPDNHLAAPRFHLARAAAFIGLRQKEATREAALAVLDHLDRGGLPTLHGRALEYPGRVALLDGDRTEAHSLLGQTISLHLVDDENDRAMRLARKILPESPERDTRRVEQEPSTGVYLGVASLLRGTPGCCSVERPEQPLPVVPPQWHDRDMTRARISTTVDASIAPGVVGQPIERSKHGSHVG